MSAFPTMPCEQCGRHAPCMNVTFVQNIGLVILRFSRTLSGQLCKPCINEAFFKMSAISFFFGWWGIISFFVTLFTLPLNVVSFLRSLSLPPPDPAAAGTLGPPAGHAPGAPSWGGPASGADFGGGPSSASPGFGSHSAAAMAPPAPRPPSKALPLSSLFVGLAGLATFALFGLVGVGMMVAPNTPKDPETGLICLLSSAACCGGPGLLGAAFGLFRLFRPPSA